METNYSQTWNKFTLTDNYSRAVELMNLKGMKQPYIDTLLRYAFDAGWDNREIYRKKGQVILPPTKIK